MEFIDGKKITEADISRRQACAVELFNAIVSSCLFSEAEPSIFHADPHAGNILILKDGTPGIALIDWSQTGTLTKAVRASILRLASGIATNNPRIVLEAAIALSGDGNHDAARATIEGEIEKSPAGPPFIEGALALLDRLALRGIKFPADLLLFRKAIFTLGGVLLCLDPEFDQDVCLINYMAALLAQEMPQRWVNLFFPYADSPFNYRSLMSNAELFMYGAGLLNQGRWIIAPYSPPL
jgi:ubiquinone biosynthesis protein